MMETATTTLAGLAAKRYVSLELCQPTAPETLQYHKIVAIAFMQDAVRLLNGQEAPT